MDGNPEVTEEICWELQHDIPNGVKCFVLPVTINDQWLWWLHVITLGDVCADVCHDGDGGSSSPFASK